MRTIIEIDTQVTRDLSVADKLTVRAANRIDQHVRPHQGTVLANAPPLLFEAAIGGRNVQSSGRQVRGPILFGVELGEVLPDDLVGRIALEALSAGVPARDIPLRVEHIDCVIDD